MQVKRGGGAIELATRKFCPLDCYTEAKKSKGFELYSCADECTASALVPLPCSTNPDGACHWLEDQASYWWRQYCQRLSMVQRHERASKFYYWSFA